jgi:hypothetical protein
MEYSLGTLKEQSQIMHDHPVTIFIHVQPSFSFDLIASQLMMRAAVLLLHFPWVSLNFNSSTGLAAEMVGFQHYYHTKASSGHAFFILPWAR